MPSAVGLRCVAQVALGVVLAATAYGTAHATEPAEPTAAYYWFSYWLSIGNLEAAARQFAADAFVVVAPSCPAQAPCVGRAAIRDRYLARIARLAAERPVLDQRLEGTTLRAHDERSYGGVDRYAFELRDGAIVSLTFGQHVFDSVAHRTRD